MGTSIRLYKKQHYRQDRLLVRESTGFKHYIITSTCDRYMQSGGRSESLSFMDKEVGMSVAFASEKDGIWICWRPGWGVDGHFPPDRCPEYLKRCDAHNCDLVEGGKCRSDGSSLADGEQFWPAFNSGGVERVFSLLEEWWRPANYGDDE